MSHRRAGSRDSYDRSSEGQCMESDSDSEVFSEVPSASKPLDGDDVEAFLEESRPAPQRRRGKERDLFENERSEPLPSARKSTQNGSKTAGTKSVKWVPFPSEIAQSLPFTPSVDDRNPEDGYARVPTVPRMPNLATVKEALSHQFDRVALPPVKIPAHITRPSVSRGPTKNIDSLIDAVLKCEKRRNREAIKTNRASLRAMRELRSSHLSRVHQSCFESACGSSATDRLFPRLEWAGTAGEGVVSKAAIPNSAPHLRHIYLTLNHTALPAFTKTMLGEKAGTQVLARRLPSVLPCCRSTSWVGLVVNHLVEDDPVLRYVPYFGDEDQTGVDVSFYDCVPDAATVGRTSRSSSTPLSIVVAQVFAHVYRNELTPSLVTRLVEEKGLSSKHLEQASEAAANTIDPSKNSGLCLKALQVTPKGRAPTKEIVHGLKKTDSYAELEDNFRDLFCRRCYKYDCSLHGVMQPRPRVRQDPFDETGQRAPPPSVRPFRSSADYKTTELPACKANPRQGKRRKTTSLQPQQKALLTKAMQVWGKAESVLCGDREATSSIASIVFASDPSQPDWKDVTAMVKKEVQKRSSTAVVRQATTAVEEDQQSKKKASHKRKKSAMFSSIVQRRRKQFKGGPSSPTLTLYRPCDHEGPCSQSNCSCVAQGRFCEKYCGCGPSCKKLFPGCDCGRGGCRQACPCVVAGRECDPDLCRSCGADVCVPPPLACHGVDTAHTTPLSRLDLSSAMPLTRAHHRRVSREKRLMRFMLTDWEDITAAEDGPSSLGTASDVSFPSSSFFAPTLGERPSHCPNMALRRREHKKILLGRSSIHGWGAFIGEKARKHDLIYEYRGELITQNEADRRGKIYDKLKCSFLFNLNDELVVDATRKGNKIKFANHHDDANCMARVMLVNADHKIGIFAKRDIEEGEELSFSYSDSYWTAGALEAGDEHVI